MMRSDEFTFGDKTFYANVNEQFEQLTVCDEEGYYLGFQEIPLEVVTRIVEWANGMQHRSVATVGEDLWSREQILLKMTEELEELTQACRRDGDVEGELGDLQFALCRFAEKMSIKLVDAFETVMEKHKKDYEGS